MSFGKMTSFIDIIQTEQSKDADGFAISNDIVLASIRTYREYRHGNEMWANRAAFSTATTLFRFRVIPDVTVDTTMIISCGDERFYIVSAENVRNRGMYIEVLAEKIKASKQ